MQNNSEGRRDRPDTKVAPKSELPGPRAKGCPVDDAAPSEVMKNFTSGVVTECIRLNIRKSPSSDGDVVAIIDCDNLPEALEGTPWRYCPVRLFYEHRRRPLVLCTFFSRYLKHPRLEHLIKTGFYGLPADMVYNNFACEIRLDETQDRTHRILGVMAEDVPFLQDLDVKSKGLEVYQEYCRMNLKDRQA